MWIASKSGFYSIVQTRDNQRLLMVRARAEKDLINLKNNVVAFKNHEILLTLDADYRFRLIVTRDELHELMQFLTEEIDYPNFKDKIHETPDQKDKLTYYSKIWSTMHDYQKSQKKINRIVLENFRGCLLGGAVGDALGAPTEFMSLDHILSKFGAGGVTEYIEFQDGIGRITDDTQMTLFTAEAMLRTIHRSVQKGIWGAYLQISHGSYLRWLHTQQFEMNRKPQFNLPMDGWLIRQSEIFKRPAPGNTCISSLQSGNRGTIDEPINNSKGCGGIMRVAPVGLMKSFEPKMAFQIAAELAAITHGHPSGFLSAGVFAAIIAYIREGQPLLVAINEASKILTGYKNYSETHRAIETAIRLSHLGEPTFEKVEKLGGGWVGEEALAIAIYCSLCFQNDFEKAIVLAINHSGDTDSTGAITGNILGLLLGEQAIPKRWTEKLEMNRFISQIGEDLYIECPVDSFSSDKEWEEKYPPN